MIPKKIRPMMNHIVTTMDRFENDDSKLILDIKEAKGVVKDIQKVLAVGPLVRDVKVGDFVRINPDKYIRVKHNLRDDLNNENEMEVKINFPVVDLESGRFLFLTEGDVDYVIEEFAEEKQAEKSVLYTPPIII